MTASMTRFVIDKSDLRKAKTLSAPLPDLQPGEILLKVDSFAFTANNITYAELGERMAYWNFFPAGNGQESNLGVVPVWGFADVTDSRHEAIGPGERIFGFFPMATHAVLQPVKLTDNSFVDATEHRKALPPAYNFYVRTTGDAAFLPDREGLQALLRPLFITAFLIDDFLADEDFFGAGQVILSSASSKTAFGLAWLLRRRGKTEVIGLTSAGNRAFVEGLGCYDRVLLYDDIAKLNATKPAVYVDFAGSAAVRTTIHQHFGEALKYSCAVGLSHREMNPPGKNLPGPKPVFFFAPDRIKKRTQDWGRGGIDTRFGDAMGDFLPHAGKWLTVIEGSGAASVEAAWQATLAGQAKPDEGQMLSLWE
ncbi:DUF2855 family protein [Ferrovibrio xuzhouensis]|uniref:DUF2855 family protein n=1 Tax=Ferrovibrio xuzhouensis TaxID=1576914 RepID=A0ABV7VG33_9PROT